MIAAPLMAKYLNKPAQAANSDTPYVDPTIDTKHLKPINKESGLEEKLKEPVNYNPEFINEAEEKYLVHTLYGAADNIAGLLRDDRPQYFGVFQGQLQSQMRYEFARTLKKKGYDKLADIVENDINLGTSYFWVRGRLEEKGELDCDEELKDFLKLTPYDNGLSDKQLNIFARTVLGAGLANAKGPFPNKIPFMNIVALRIMNDPTLTDEEKQELLEKLGLKDNTKIKDPDQAYVRADEAPQVRLPK